MPTPSSLTFRTNVSSLFRECTATAPFRSSGKASRLEETDRNSPLLRKDMRLDIQLQRDRANSDRGGHLDDASPQRARRVAGLCRNQSNMDGAGDRGRRAHPLGPRDRGAGPAHQRARGAASLSTCAAPSCWPTEKSFRSGPGNDRSRGTPKSARSLDRPDTSRRHRMDNVFAGAVGVRLGGGKLDPHGVRHQRRILHGGTQDESGEKPNRRRLRRVRRPAASG